MQCYVMGLSLNLGSNVCIKLVANPFSGLASSNLDRVLGEGDNKLRIKLGGRCGRPSIPTTRGLDLDWQLDQFTADEL